MEVNVPGMDKIQGKVRDIYDLGDKILIVVTDRLSAFDVIMDDGVPGKGKVLNSISTFWFRKLGHLCPTHLISADIKDYPAPFNEMTELQGRSMLVRKLKVVPYECIVRGYLTGSGWAEYKKQGTVNGQPLREGYQNASKLDEVLFTPTTKAAIGDHDMAISVEEMTKDVGETLATTLRDLSIALYTEAAKHAESRGIILADTKFEFGLDEAGNVVLADEALTPDSSRFWAKDTYAVGSNPPSMDKQFVRDWLDSINFNHQPPAPALPDEVIAKTQAIYAECYQRLTEGEACAPVL
ncbi:MAG: phosphoribosylaminoimidazolesuccinocarboxamide synthase [Kiritimatiellae bacterium]|nr:phosphoribosylaminoimidazolesuccinocarboxamide synthase [Kiritimatiellia bacterium]MBR5588469.1 phosphoribosylaminoimidazolesuccinocarboxamide synthase [Kiritimatiellia bacterium]